MQAEPHPGDIVGSVILARGAGNANSIITTTKPYVCGSNYLRKMGDY
jgi:deoxyribodipyrimidine photolyase-like uncharacterized protein